MPAHVVLPKALTGVKAPIVVLLGRRFPMIGAHKVLAAYACLVPRLVTGRFDPARDRAIWPSTGNYCRGGVAISRILGCRGVAVLPAGMSRERFDWLERLGRRSRRHHPHARHREQRQGDLRQVRGAGATIRRTSSSTSSPSSPTTSSTTTARAARSTRVLAPEGDATASYRLAAFVSATGSAGTIAAGDYLKARHGTKIAAVEAIECPTMLCNGYGEHNIQGIGDKHIPLIHNVMNTDLVVGVSDAASDALNCCSAAMSAAAI